jgi:hypothetical protein
LLSGSPPYILLFYPAVRYINTVLYAVIDFLILKFATSPTLLTDLDSLTTLLRTF